MRIWHTFIRLRVFRNRLVLMRAGVYLKSESNIFFVCVLNHQFKVLAAKIFFFHCNLHTICFFLSVRMYVWLCARVYELHNDARQGCARQQIQKSKKNDILSVEKYDMKRHVWCAMILKEKLKEPIRKTQTLVWEYKLCIYLVCVANWKLNFSQTNPNWPVENEKPHTNAAGWINIYFKYVGQ